MIEKEGPLSLFSTVAVRGSSHRRKSTLTSALHGLTISLAYSSGEEGGILLVKNNDFFLPSLRLEGGFCCSAFTWTLYRTVYEISYKCHRLFLEELIIITNDGNFKFFGLQVKILRN
jgi:hypothetical protein